MSFTKQSVKALRAKLQHALDDAGIDFDIDVGNASYDAHGVTFKVNIKEHGALSQKERDLSHMARIHDLDVSKTGVHGAERYRLSGYKRTARKRPWVMCNVANGKEYVIDDYMAKVLFAA